MRDQARKILRAIADDLGNAQSDAEQKAKSKGDSPQHAPGITKYARSHAMERLSHGFTLNDMVSEYRALRASVIRHWIAQLKNADRTALEEVVRFNEAVGQKHDRIDQAVRIVAGAGAGARHGGTGP